MPHFILSFAGSPSQLSEQIAQVHKTPNIRVVDAMPAALLVEGSEQAVSELAKAMPQCKVSAEKTYSVPPPKLPTPE